MLKERKSIHVPNQNQGSPPNQSWLNFQKALRNLERSLSTPVMEPRDLSGIIKDFEMAEELSWKVVKKWLKSQGHDSLGSKDVFSKAFRLGLINDELEYLAMIDDRNQAAHVYDEHEAKLLVERIRDAHLGLLKKLEQNLAALLTAQ